jgi:hypothetical protein
MRLDARIVADDGYARGLPSSFRCGGVLHQFCAALTESGHTLQLEHCPLSVAVEQRDARFVQVHEQQWLLIVSPKKVHPIPDRGGLTIAKQGSQKQNTRPLFAGRFLARAMHELRCCTSRRHQNMNHIWLPEMRPTALPKMVLSVCFFVPAGRARRLAEQFAVPEPISQSHFSVPETPRRTPSLQQSATCTAATFRYSFVLVGAVEGSFQGGPL